MTQSNIILSGQIFHEQFCTLAIINIIFSSQKTKVRDWDKNIIMTMKLGLLLLSFVVLLQVSTLSMGELTQAKWPGMI